MNLPIFLTLSRIFAVPILVVVLLSHVYNSKHQIDDLSIILATLIFLGASVTDYFDGYFARRRQQITTVGILLDPIADKLLMSAAFVSLVELGWVPAWMVVIIIGRELAVAGLRAIAATQGCNINASELGKIKTVLQVVAITTIILRNIYSWLEPISLVTLWLVVIFALVSAIDYFQKFWKTFDNSVKVVEDSKSVVFKKKQRDVST
ncbi:MAG: CDP-diacylglycerol--glycerol-3-phosphate 3-phosphatidyltransferase [Acidobacteriia bacterium]|nr:CDP-diacylglycerol--glycerol-3-phosphate 3-phosphatidyltransferase [Terriglobia bacterium]